MTTTQNSEAAGIYSNSSEISIVDATISRNESISSLSGGGGLFLTGSGEVVIDSSTISSNTASSSGGGILNNSDTLQLRIINGSDIINNSSTSSSGGGVLTKSPLTVDNSSIRFNFSKFAGGGINCRDCQFMSIINSSQISNNTTETSGGGIYISAENETVVEFRNSSFTSNSGPFNGGAIAQDSGTLLIDSCTFSGNNADEKGGAIYLFDLDSVQDSLRITHSVFFNNFTTSDEEGDGGGALHLNEIENAQITGSDFNNNNSERDGGAVYLFDTELTISDSTVNENEAYLEGGGVYAQESELTINNSSISSNQSYDEQNLFPGRIGGGGIKTLNSNLKLINTQVNQNTHNDMGGGIFYDGGIDNTLSISSSYGSLDGQCLPASLGLDEYCSEVSFNTALLGSGIIIKSPGSNSGININGLALNQNVSSSFGSLPSNSGAVLQFDLDEFLDTEVTIENMIMVENEGFIDDLPLIQVNGDVTLELLSSTIAENTGKPLNVTNEDSTVILQTSILQQNTAGSLVGNDVSFISLCNNAEQADASGQSFGANLDDPQFITDARGDYRLSPTSPSLDVCSFGSAVDIDGNSRPDSNNNFDQGAFELNATLVSDIIFVDGFE